MATNDREQQRHERVLSKQVMNQLERWAHAGKDVLLLVRVRNGKVCKTGFLRWHTYAASLLGEDEEATD